MSRPKAHHAIYLAAGLCGLLIVWNPANFIADDSYFYLCIADHVAAGEGPTFNGLYRTNGFHPLWVLVLVPAAALTESRLAFTRGVALLHVAIATGALTVLHATLRKIADDLWAPVGLLPLLFVLFALGVTGSEAALSALMIAVVLWMLVHILESDGRAHTRTYLGLGLALGLSLLARLDTLFFAAVVLTHLAATRSVRRASAAGVLTSAVVAPYLGWNLYEFGTFVPVTAAVKSSFPQMGPHLGGLSSLHMVLLAGCAVALLAIPARLLDETRAEFVALVCLPPLIHGAYHYLFQSSASWYWYCVSAAIGCGIGAVAIAARVVETLSLEGRSTRASTTVASVAGAGVVFGLAVWDKPPTHDPWRLEYASKLDSALPADATLAVADRTGRTQFYTDARVVGLDGLTANRSFHDTLHRSGLQTLFCAHEVDFVLWERGDAMLRRTCARESSDGCTSYRLTARSRMYGDEWAGSITVAARDRVFTYPSRGTTGRIEVWKFDRRRYCARRGSS